MNGLTLFLGKSFTGKTVRMLHEVHQYVTRVVLVDGKCADLVGLGGWTHLWPEYDPSAKRWKDESVSEVFRKQLRHFFRVVIHFRAHHVENLNLLCFLLMRVKHLVLAVDELGLFLPSGPPSAVPPHTTAVLVSGRHDGIAFWGTAQRPMMVNGLARANVEDMFIFRITEENDVESLRGYLPEPFFSALGGLPEGVCLRWRDGRDPYLDATMQGKLGDLLPARVPF